MNEIREQALASKAEQSVLGREVVAADRCKVAAGRRLRNDDVCAWQGQMNSVRYQGRTQAGAYALVKDFMTKSTGNIVAFQSEILDSVGVGTQSQCAAAKAQIARFERAMEHQLALQGSAGATATVGALTTRAGGDAAFLECDRRRESRGGGRGVPNTN